MPDEHVIPYQNPVLPYRAWLLHNDIKKAAWSCKIPFSSHKAHWPTFSPPQSAFALNGLTLQRSGGFLHMKDAKLTEFDDETLKDHSYLRADDDCYFFIECTAGKGYSHSKANGFMANLKKKPTVDKYQLKHKSIAIREAAETLAEELPQKWLKKSTFVPIPPSKAKKHADYDDRMSKVLAKVGKADVRELVYQLKSMDPTHTLKKRHTIPELVANYKIDENLADPEPTHIVIVDDMVTAGAHYRAMRQVLRKRFPDVPISAVFLSRRIFADDEEEEDDDE